MTMSTGAVAMTGIITRSRITRARVAMKNRTIAATAANPRDTATAAAAMKVNHTGAGMPAGITTSLTAVTITAAMTLANARASRTTGATTRADPVSLITAARTGAAARSVASLSARAMRSGHGSATRTPSGGGVWTRGAGGMRGAARAATVVPTNASAKM